MKFQSIMVFGVILAMASGCGDDTGKGRRRNLNPKKPDIDPIETEKSLLNSTMHRDRGALPLTHEEEVARLIKNDLPPAYRIIPDMSKDDEGQIGKTVLSQSHIGRPKSNCGTGISFSGVDARIKDCQEKNGVSASWDGAVHASSGEGLWRLVARTPNAELWIDTRTGLVWSDNLGSANWCQASGNDQQPSELITADCNALAEGKKLCPDFIADGVGDIAWRLPTRNDFLQAEIDGVRFVLKGQSESFWTATMKAQSEGRREAWVFSAKDGTLVAADVTGQKQVRCIGAPKR